MIRVLVAIVALAFLAGVAGWYKVMAGLSLIGLAVLLLWGLDDDDVKSIKDWESERRAREAADHIEAMQRRGRPFRA